MKKKYFVTGGSGFIGSALVKKLVSFGNFVRVMDNSSRGDVSRLATVLKDIEYVEGDIRNLVEVKKLCKGIDSVCHLAYINGTEFFYSRPHEVLEVGVKGIMNVLEGCIEHDVPELLLMSSSEVYQTPATIPTDESIPLLVPDPLKPRYSYGGGKIISELLAINYGRKYFERSLIIRPHNVYGGAMGYEHVLPQFITRMCELTDQFSEGVIKFPIQGDGNETRSFVYIDDFINGVQIVLDKGDNLGIYHIGTQDEVNIKEVARKVADCFARKIEIVPGKLQEGGTKRRCPNISKVTALGYCPEISLSEGLIKTTQWYRDDFQKKRGVKK
ncbi:MAG: NAD-dependent dehydratase [Bdellovibrionales bacterium RIFOXYD12_FULL_39_22]|nr:MAG: NAD-dependent dehydratase [Bdellovibrionales bacterium RIFOXYB1_FULL_39_21]OFZ41546.1 MAG: NAD-dependent dehydratase [Bdellovibrionales bacterium RIFOXYC12_FULL_39_17]OFZ45859.1 MAG: NAD-dependent dehydratase [Bdellovibrionales bacterium RIFOXYC1_FULL_39_130]OFZ72791.1 MAG: NAD-dependent dehydratase [Bdellovibrionales bacterium RIFOXYC2_FULL_39_8]OFZ74791.1 MAG: NAD-dependent dehydratase [Bdellovibrionales bacterium RIFOXYD1_FULL_39_84]OFZ92651.1 MAG: NAD-dependent dehydratase [Bdellov